MHLDAGDIQRALHGELPPARADALGRHLETCVDCAAALAEAEREEAHLFGALAALDRPAPDVRASSIHAAARQAAPRRWDGAPWLRWAAAIALGVGMAGVAYAAPGSPVREWIAALTERLGPPPELGPSEGPPTRPSAGGIGVAPGDRLVIELAGSTSGAALRVVFVDAAEAMAGGGSGQVTFTLAPGRLLIGDVGADTIQLDIPRAAPRVEVRNGGAEVGVAQGGAFLVNGAALGGPGPFIVVLPSSP